LITRFLVTAYRAPLTEHSRFTWRQNDTAGPFVTKRLSDVAAWRDAFVADAITRSDVVNNARAIAGGMRAFRATQVRR
jgi:hypothetical protein